jgi:hypothetical protein
MMSISSQQSLFVDFSKWRPGRLGKRNSDYFLIIKNFYYGYRCNLDNVDCCYCSVLWLTNALEVNCEIDISQDELL